MAYSHQTLERRLELSRQLTSAYTRSGDFVDLQFSGPGRTLQIPFPNQLRPVPSTEAVRDPALPLPAADVVVLTYTSDEGKALADVMTPGRFEQDWNQYTNNYAGLLPTIRRGAPARQAGRLGNYWTTQVGTKKVLVFKSELHMHQDFIMQNGHPTLPIKALFGQIIQQVQPSYFFCIGTAGGTLLDKPLGTIAMSRALKFDCQKDFANEPYAKQAAPYTSDWTVPLQHRATALALMKPFAANLVIQRAGPFATCPCGPLRQQEGQPPEVFFLIDGQDGIAASFPVLTTDFFEFGTDSNGLQNQGIAVEMDDAVLGLVTSTLPRPPHWASIRNYSDPAIDGALAERAQENCASHIYMRYGYWTSVLGAIATWSIIAGL
jgi:hypothetical protein